MSTTKILVWDLPTRVFHWLLTVGLTVCLVLAYLADEGSSWFQAHMLLGIALGLLVLFRIGWGIVGSRYARFSSFTYSPWAALSYLRDAFTGKDRSSVGHNPGSAYAIFAMLALLATVVATGLLMSRGSESAEELHEISSYALMAVVAVHIVGVLWYSVRHGENITLSMFTGLKQGAPINAIESSRPLSALVLIVIIGYVTTSLFLNVDRAQGQTRLPLIGTVISLGEIEEHED